MAFELSPERKAVLEDMLGRYPTKKSITIPLLHLCQEQEGWCSPEVIEYVARTLEVSTAHVQGVVTFYTLFLQKPGGKHVVFVCRTLSCELMGAPEIQHALEKKLGCHANGGPSADGNWSIVKAECLAACGGGPMIQIDDEFYESLKVEQLDDVLKKAADKPLPGKIGFSPVVSKLLK